MSMRRRRWARALFLWTAGANPASIGMRRDEVRHSVIGAGVWLTTAISSVSMFVALRLAFDLSTPPALGGALIWALFIFNIDRGLVGGRTDWIDDDGAEHDARGRRLLVWGFRLGLSAVLALTIADPLVVLLFSSEINKQLPLDNINSIKDAEAAQNLPPSDPRRMYVQNLLDIYQQRQADTKTAETNAANRAREAQCENAGIVACGPGLADGTGNPGTNGDEYRTKKKAADDAAVAVQSAQAAQDAARQAYEAANQQLNTDIVNRTTAAAQLPPATGYFARRAALDNYIAATPGLGPVRWILVALLVVVDMSAILVKAIFRDGQHDHLETAKTLQLVTGTQSAAREEGRLRLEKGTLLRNAELAAAKSEAEAQHQLHAAQTAAGLDISLADIAMDRDVRLAGIEKERKRRLADLGTDADADADAGEREDETGDGEAFEPWQLYNKRWKVLGPLHSPPQANTPWLVEDLRKEYSEPLVLKTLSSKAGVGEDDVEAKARARQAANQLALTKGFVHDNIADILDAGYDPNNGAFLVHYRYPTDLLRFLVGHSSDVDSSDPFLVRDALDYADQLAQGMIAMWTRMQRIHLDIKPSNIGMTADPRPVLKLLDFGLTARTDGLSPTGADSHTPRGTPFYAAPEQWNAARRTDPSIDRLSAAADLRGFAATIYCMFVGRPPGFYDAFHRGLLDDPDAEPALYKMLTEEPVTPLDRYVDHLPGGFTALISQWLSIDPGHRNPGASVADAAAYGEQLLAALRFNTAAILAKPELAGLPVSALRKPLWDMGGHRPGPGDAAGGNATTLHS